MAKDVTAQRAEPKNIQPTEEQKQRKSAGGSGSNASDMSILKGKTDFKVNLWFYPWI